jgi:hypothetical protein
MRIKDLPAVVALILFVAYFGPIVVKLKEIALFFVVLGGIILVAIDVWASFAEPDD